MNLKHSVRRSLRAAAAALSMGVAVAGPHSPAGAAGAPGDAGAYATPPPGSDITTITTTCTNGLVIVLLSPFSTVPCAGR